MLLEVESLSANYGARQVLRDVSFKVSPGLVVISGRNGAGKSTLLKSIFGLVSSSAGSVRVDGEEIFGATPEKLRSKGIVYMPQGGQVFSDLTCMENLLLAGMPLDKTRATHKRAIELIHLIPTVEKKLGERARILSGGEKQWLGLCMALMPRPRLLLLDEPLAGMSDAAVTQWVQLMSDVRVTENVGILVVEQRDHVFSRESAQWLGLQNGSASTVLNVDNNAMNEL